MQLSKIGQFMRLDNGGAGINMHSTQDGILYHTSPVLVLTPDTPPHPLYNTPTTLRAKRQMGMNAYSTCQRSLRQSKQSST